MSDNIVMKVSQRNVFSRSDARLRQNVARSVARHDPVVAAGLNYIDGPHNVRGINEIKSGAFLDADERARLRGLYDPSEGKVYIDTHKYGDDVERTTAHELSHAASRRFWDDVEKDDPRLAPGANKHLDKIDMDSEPWDRGVAEEARNRLMDQKRGIWPGTQSSQDQALEDFQFVREFTHKGFNEGDTGERFRAARKREEDLLHLNAAMEEHFAKYGGGE